MRRLAVLCLLLVSRLEAQTGRVTGTVQSENNEPVAIAQILIEALAMTTETRSDGTFSLSNVPAGTYDLRVYRIGYRTTTVSGVVVSDRAETRVAVQLETTPMMVDAIVVSVSRRAEAILDAPAAVTRFDPETIGNSLGSPVSHLLERAPGIDVTQVGVTSSFVNGRGFNRTFNSRWLTVEDGRVAAFPETGLPIGEHTTTPKMDLADLEVIAGPGSALYGANASGGVMSTTSKDPRKYPGLGLELTGGTRSYSDVQARFAGSTSHWGFKISGERQTAQDWLDTMRYAAVFPGGPTLTELPRDLATRVTRVAGSARYYLGNEDAQIALNAGASLRDGLGQGGQGRYQIIDYRYNDAQLVFRSPRWFVQGYTTHSNSGDTYRLGVYIQSLTRFAGITADSARVLASFPVDGRIQAVEVQNNELIGAHIRTGSTAIDNSRVTWGLQERRDRVDSDGRLYTDVATGKPIRMEYRAAYLQIESHPTASLRVVGAARFDWDSRFKSSWSPKIGLLYNLRADRVVRVTFNGAYLAPSIFQTDVYIVNAGARLATLGNTDGFDVRDAKGAVVNVVSPVRPETNQTWEAGFKGVLGERLYVDATVYHARFRNFITQAGPVADPTAATPTFAFDHKTGRRIEDSAGNPLVLFTFINVGQGRFAGLDASLRFYLSNRVSLSSSTSLSHVIAIDSLPTDPPGASAFNTSPHRSSLQVRYLDAPRAFEVSLGARYVEGYEFRSGTDWGHIPTFFTASASASYRLPRFKTTVLLQADNVGSCVSGTTSPPVAGISATSRSVYVPGRSCGFGVRHHEILNMPAVGTMVFLGARWEGL